MNQQLNPDAPKQPSRTDWRNAAIRLGEELSSVGPDGYYDMTAQQWLEWAMAQHPRGKHLLPEQPEQEPVKLVKFNCTCGRTMNFESVHGVVAPQREPLTDGRISDLWCDSTDREWVTEDTHVFARAIEAAHGITSEGGGMSKHTPGPWRAIYVGCSDWDLDGPVTEQDWKLAAAAPELLSALQSLIDMDVAYQRGPKVEEAVQGARAAIAKVTGNTTSSV